MTDLKAQRRMAADVLDVGKDRVWMDPEEQAEIADAITRKGKAGARQNKKKAWISRIRAQRRRLRELRDDGPLSPSEYRTLYNKASGGEFDSVDRLETYIETHYGYEVK
jgi:large subunit ribosomal protein L19e